MRLGCAGAHDQLLALGEKLKSSDGPRAKGKEYVEWDNPYDVGMTGLIGFSSGYYAMNDCDALLMLGTDFPYRQFYPQGTASHRAGRHQAGAARPPRPINLGLVGDVGATLDALLPLLKEKQIAGASTEPLSITKRRDGSRRAGGR